MLLTPSWSEELAQLRMRALAASEAILAGETGPIYIGLASKDIFLRLTNELHSTLHLSWDQAGETDIGKIYYFGDPSDPHQWLTAYVSETIARDTSAQQCFGRQLGARTTELTIPSATSRNAGATRRRIKEPDGSWVPLAPRQSHRDPVLATVLEVAWLNESWTDFIREIHDWSMGGFHALGLKVWRPADSMSLVFVAREAKAGVMRIWRSGAQTSRYDARLAHGVEVEERHDDIIDLPASWFGWCPPSSSKKVALSLRSLLEEAVAAANLGDSAQVLGLDEECQSLSREVESIRACTTLDGTNKATLIQCRQSRVDAINEARNRTDEVESRR
ncbi:unnamed protein product [Jaminaea pallidilutea]